MAAAFNGDVEETERILLCPVDIDAQDNHGVSALMYAAMKGHEAVVERLVSRGARVDIQSAQAYTALMYGVRANSVETVRRLLKAGADPNVHGDSGVFDTPLTIAADHGLFPMVRVLVAGGALVSLHGGYGQMTAECIARRKGNHEISEYLLYHEKRPEPEN